MIDRIQVMDLSFLREVPEDVMSLSEKVNELNSSNALLRKKKNNLEIVTLVLSIGLVILTISFINRRNIKNEE
jgi:uncharacterized membrane protein YozB (DUF420 family)